MPQTALQKSKRRAVKLLIALACFYLLMTLFLRLTGKYTDEVILQWMQQHRHDALWWITKVMAEIGEPHLTIPKAIIPALFLIFYGYRREAFFLMATLLADVANLILKEIINRERPTLEIAYMLEEASNPGFPSGHTVNFIVYFGFVLVLLPLAKNLTKTARNILTALLVFFIFVGPFTRIHGGMHWPSDVIGGGIIGTLFLAMLCYAYFTPGRQE